jgi:hypothetical protein
VTEKVAGAFTSNTRLFRLVFVFFHFFQLKRAAIRAVAAAILFEQSFKKSVLSGFAALPFFVGHDLTSIGFTPGH